MRFIAARFFGRRRRGRRLLLALTLFTRRTRDGLDRNGRIAMAHRCRNSQTVGWIKKHGWRGRTGVKRFRNNITRSLDPSRARRTRDMRRGSWQRLFRNKGNPFTGLRD